MMLLTMRKLRRKMMIMNEPRGTMPRRQADLDVSRTYATLRLFGKTIEPDVVKGRLGIAPTFSYRPGERRGRKGPWPYGYWELCSQPFIASKDLSDHIGWLLAQVEPVKDVFCEIARESDRADIFCFWESSVGHGGPTFSAALLGRVATLGLELGIDIYFVS
jgi:hypothetical protein